jgi:hypothetical protein
MNTEKAVAQKITGADCSALAQAVHEFLMSTPTMSADLLMFFKNTQKKLDVIGKVTYDKQQKIIKKHVKMKGNNFVLTEPTPEEVAQGAQAEYIYKSDDDQQKAEVAIRALFKQEVKTKFKKIHPSLISNLQVSPRANQNFALIMDFLLEEIPEEAEKMEAVK